MTAGDGRQQSQTGQSSTRGVDRGGFGTTRRFTPATPGELCFQRTRQRLSGSTR